MVDVLRSGSAVLARVAIAREDRSTVERHPSRVWDFDECPQPYDRRQRVGGPFGVPYVTAVLYNNCLLPQDQDYGSPRGNDGERLVRCVEDQSPHESEISCWPV